MASPRNTAITAINTTTDPLPLQKQQQQQQQPPPSASRRVRRACEYCRRKRLKCTANRRPCMNCQLYGAECISVPDVPGTGVSRRRRSRAASSRPPSVDDTGTGTGTGPGPGPGPGPGSGMLGVVVDELRHQPRTPDGDMDRQPLADVNAGSGGYEPPPHPSQMFPSPEPSSLSVFDHTTTIGEADIDVSHEFWGFDDLIATFGAPDELAATEELLAPQSPSAAAENAALPSFLSRGPRPRRLVGEIFGVETLVPQSTSTSGAISSGLFHQKDKGSSQFLGFTSTAAILALCVRESRQGQSLRFIADCGPLCDEISCSAVVADVPPQQIPSTTLAAQCVNIFFEDYHASHPILDQGDMTPILERFVCNGHRELSPLERSLLYLVTALGACSRSASVGSGSLINFENLYALAWNMVPHAIAVPSLQSVQVLLLHVLYNIHWSKWSIAWVLCGLAVRMAQSVGLHLASPRDSGLELGQLKLRARLWAVAFILDAHLSMSQGRPPACQISQCDAELLINNKNGLLHLGEVRWPLSEVLMWRVSLARIQQQLNQAFSSVVTPEQRLSCLEEVDLSLMRWKDELPREFRPEQQMFLDSNAHIDIYMLHLDYFNLLQVAHWCLITHRPGANLRDHTIPRLRASESICLDACLALVRTLNAMTDGDTRTRSFRSRSDHFLSAMAIIYRDLSRNPGKVSARTNLEYLRVIRLHLGRMANKHLLAASLTSVIDNMVNSAESRVQEHGNISLANDG